MAEYGVVRGDPIDETPEAKSVTRRNRNKHGMAITQDEDLTMYAWLYPNRVDADGRTFNDELKEAQEKATRWKRGERDEIDMPEPVLNKVEGLPDGEN